ncbi:putative cytokinetic ring protein SteA [Desulfotomaculum copahuensis]|uniref:Thiamin pyrophosphokinase n=1 Tax=Desulfotomaculum copahuensis TaxID=1838280 RepID=A0A1B7LJ59_9FIRM|nr:putative cytokinetic ring protein SteA [Desulfotomaculum copahuensis]OAT86511.1 thiamin pyrophosphokinase [Desulfotomaculum copahuensis]
MYVKGTVRVDSRTKNLVKRLLPHEIAVIDHAELDDVAAHSLIAGRVRAVINASPSLSARYPNAGPLTLVQAGIPLVDNAGPDVMALPEGAEVEIRDGVIYLNRRELARGKVLTDVEIRRQMNAASRNMGPVLSRFVENTMEHARREMCLVAGDYRLPRLKNSFHGRHALIVVRGQNYKEDLNTIKSYINEIEPVLVGVDGGADALVECGYRPDLIVGDMDSVMDETLKCGAELVVHAYPDGRAPGLQRIRKLGLPAEIFAAPGTSEDIAMLLAFDGGAELIVAVGAHSSVEDFLEKGRQGMASTFLVRMKVGSILVDAKGVSKLYRNRIKARYLAQIVLAALLPAGAVVFVSPATRELLRLLIIQFRLFLGI